MKRRYWLGIALLFLLSTALIAAYLFKPRLVGIEPAPGVNDVPVSKPIRLVFSRPMQPETVLPRLEIFPALPGDFAWEDNNGGNKQNTLTFKPHHLWPGGTSIQVRLAAGALAQGWPPLAISEDTTWTFGTRTPQILYLFPSDAPPELYLLNPLTGAIEKISETGGALLDYCISPDGQYIYYSLRQSEGGSRLEKLDLQSGKTQSIAKFHDLLLEALQISPNGDTLAFEGSLLTNEAVQVQVRLVSIAELSSGVNGSGQAQGSIVGDPDHETQLPLWSSSGLLAFYNRTLERFEFLNLETGERINTPSTSGQSGAWSPDGNFFVFPEILTRLEADPTKSTAGGELDIPTSHLLLFDLASGKLTDLSQKKYVEDTAPAFSPDGKKIAFTRKFLDPLQWTPGRQLWVMDLASGTAITKYLEPQYNHYNIQWSPSGDQITYLRFNQTTFTEPPEIWLINAENFSSTGGVSSEPIRLVQGGFAQQWIP